MGLSGKQTNTLIIFSTGGVILDYTVANYKGIAVYNPVINGINKSYMYFFMTYDVHLDFPFFIIILLCLMPDNFTRQGESTATQWVNQTICLCTLLTL